MKINTFIAILFITFIICKNNTHIKGIAYKPRQLVACLATLGERTETYKEITGITPATDQSFVNLNYIVYVDKTTLKDPVAHKYSYHSYTNPTQVGNTGLYKSTTVAKLDYTLTGEAISEVHNYGYPWTKGSEELDEDFSFGSVADGGFVATCDVPAKDRMVNLLAAPDAATVAKYEKIDQYMVSYPEPRSDITDEVIGQGIKLNWVDTDKKNYNMLLTKGQFCHYSCTAEIKDTKAECDLLVYPKSKYNAKTINQAIIITVDGSAKLFENVKADTTAANVKDKCSDELKPAECTDPQYTIMSKGENKVLTGYFKDVQNKYLVSTAESPEMPADIKAKFPEYTYCFEIPKVQGVSNMFINSIELILIVIFLI